MKKVIFLLTISLSIITAKAQKYDEIKNLLLFNKLDQAKTDFDKAFTNAKFAAKPEAFILKTAIYAGLAMTDANKAKPLGDQYRTEADAAFKKYLEMDPAAALINDPVYQNGPINLYSSYYAGGYADYLVKSWSTAFEKCKRAAELSDMLIAKKLLTTPMDTNILILAGITAESNGNKEEATKYYTRLADAKVGGDGFESVYRFLVSFFFGKKDLTSFEKYKELGGQIYPKSEYFKFDKIDFAVGLVEGFENKIKSVEEMLVTDPDNYKANEILGELIYDTLNSTKEGAVLPANAEELEKKMISVFEKAYTLKPDTIITQLLLSEHFYNKTQWINDKRSAHAKVISAKTKPTADDLKKREELDKELAGAYELLRGPSEKVAEFYSKHGNLTLREKQYYKKAAGYLSDVFVNKRVRAKGNVAEQAKFAAEEKKWNDVYDSIKN